MNKLLENARQMYKLKNLVRYNNIPKIRNETVLEHTAVVALVVLNLSDKYNFDVDLAIKLALVHDICETEISDVAFNVKQKYNKIAIAMSEAENTAINVFSNDIQTLLHKLKHNSVEQKMVKFADIISCKLYSETEVELGNSGYMQQVLNETDKRIRNFKKILEQYKK